MRQQEEQVRLLQEITSRKDEQLLKLQEQLEGALAMLTTGQETYSKQSLIFEYQKRTIGQLRGQIEAADSIGAACEANAAEAAAGRAAAAAARRERYPKPGAPAAKATKPMQAESPGSHARAAAAAAAQQTADTAANNGNSTQDDEDEDAAMEETLEEHGPPREASGIRI